MSIFSHHSRSFKGPISARRLRRGGFTLIELLVVLSIMVIVTAFLLFRQSKFDSSTLLRSLAFSVALSVRQAQVYGESPLAVTTPVTCIGRSDVDAFGFCYAKSYGLYFSCPGSSSCDASTYILFADFNDNGQYDTGELVKTFTLGNGYAIADVGVTTADISATVKSFKNGLITNGGNSNFTVLFTRPYPDACFASSNSANACQTGVTPTESYSSAFVQIQSTVDPNSTRTVRMNVTGQISVDPVGP